MTRFSYLLPLALLTLALPVKAQQVDENMQAQATVARSCSMTQPQSVDFGSYDPVAANSITGAGIWRDSSILVKCTAGMSGVALRLDKGTSGLTTICPVPLRYLVGPNNKNLIYHLYTENGVGWGCSQDGGHGDAMTRTLDPFTDSLNSREVKFSMVVPRGQDAPMGTYVDTISVELIF